MRLARTLGYTLNDLLNSLGEGELDLWFEFSKKNPLPDPWLQAGEICNTFARFNGWFDHKTKADDFIPKYREPPTPAQRLNRFILQLKALGVPIIDKRPTQ